VTTETGVISENKCNVLLPVFFTGKSYINVQMLQFIVYGHSSIYSSVGVNCGGMALAP